MYETLRYVGDVLLQGLLTSLFMLLLAWWYEKRVTSKRAKVAALFIVLELEDHLAVLAMIIKQQSFPGPNDEDYCFRTQNWEVFKNNLAPLLKYEDLKGLASYYQSVNVLLAAIRRSEPYCEHVAIAVNCLDKAKYFCAFLWQLADDSRNQHTFSMENLG